MTHIHKLLFATPLLLAVAACGQAAQDQAGTPAATDATAAPAADAKPADAAAAPAGVKPADAKPADAAAAPAGAKPAAAAAPTAAAKPAAAKTAAVAAPSSFTACATCHAVEKGAPDKIGPNLFGSFGAKAAVVDAKFEYSPQLKKSGLVWDEATLDKWLAKPRTLVKGTYMSYPGIKSASKRKEVIDYMKTLK